MDASQEGLELVRERRLATPAPNGAAPLARTEVGVEEPPRANFGAQDDIQQGGALEVRHGIGTCASRSTS